MTLDTLISIILQGLTLGMLYFLTASGLSLIFGLMDVLNFAHGSIFMIGAYVAWVTTEALAGSLPNSDARFALALLAGTLAGAGLGALIEWAGIRPLYKRPIFQVLLTLGLVFVINETVKLLWKADIHSLARPASLAGVLMILDRPFPTYRLFLIGLGLVVLAAMSVLLRRTRLGMIIRAGVENGEMVQALGIDVRRVFTLVFALGSALAALGGAAAAPFIGLVPTMGMDYQLSAFAVVVIGGMGSFAGSAVGAVLVWLGRAFADYQLSPLVARATVVGLMALVLLVKPTGLFGVKKGGH